MPLVDYLRISVTDRCNLRCIYCMPAEGVESVPHGEILTYEEIGFFCRAAVDSGIRRVRLTGGEPLVRKGCADLVRMLTPLHPELKVSLTTNGVLLARFAAGLKEAGLSRVNVSLDSLDPDVYRSITRAGNLEEALSGLHRAIEVGLEPVKVNVVVLKGVNDDVAPFADLTRELPVHVRFIEYMPYFNQRGKWFVPSEVTKEKLAETGELEQVEPPEGWGPAEYMRFEGAPGTVGFISPVSCHFCPKCNRLRLSAEGKMRTCLFDRNGVDVKAHIRGGAGQEKIREIIESELERKRREGNHKPAPGTPFRVGDHMSRIGG